MSRINIHLLKSGKYDYTITGKEWKAMNSKQPPADQQPIDPETIEKIFANCRIEKTDCEHEFTQNGNPDSDYCTKCGQSVWAWAFKEMP